jgi:hypothetical protein
MFCKKIKKREGLLQNEWVKKVFLWRKPLAIKGKKAWER